jgi:hypothetical protein
VPGCPRPLAAGAPGVSGRVVVRAVSHRVMDCGAGGRFDRVVSSDLRTREDETVMPYDTAGTAISEAVEFGAAERRLLAAMPLRLPVTSRRSAAEEKHGRE